MLLPCYFEVYRVPCCHQIYFHSCFVSFPISWTNRCTPPDLLDLMLSPAHKPQKLFKQAIHIIPEELQTLFLQSLPPTGPVYSLYSPGQPPCGPVRHGTSSSGAVFLINKLLFDCYVSLFGHFILFRAEDSFFTCRLDRCQSKHHIIWCKETTKPNNFSKSTFGQPLLSYRFQVSDGNIFFIFLSCITQT